MNMIFSRSHKLFGIDFLLVKWMQCVHFSIYVYVRILICVANILYIDIYRYAPVHTLSAYQALRQLPSVSLCAISSLTHKRTPLRITSRLFQFHFMADNCIYRQCFCSFYEWILPILSPDGRIWVAFTLNNDLMSFSFLQTHCCWC